MKHVELPLDPEKAAALFSGDKVLISGTIYTARDAAHRRMIELLDSGKPLPFPLAGEVIYYTGPTPPPPGSVTGSAGPTTSYRMDAYTPRLLRLGLRAMIGKGGRSQEVIEAIKETGSVYFGALGGAGALLGSRITSSQIIAFEDLGTEAIRRLTVKDFPATVVIDSQGNDLYVTGRKKYLAAR